jgi:hypothetical protein
LTLSKKACPACRLLSLLRMICWVTGTKVEFRSCASASLKSGPLGNCSGLMA